VGWDEHPTVKLWESRVGMPGYCRIFFNQVILSDRKMLTQIIPL